MNDSKITQDILCYHCGERCDSMNIALGQKYFCCEGCKLVYELLQENNLCNYYSIEKAPGNSPKSGLHSKKYEFLDDDSTANRLISFQNDELAKVTFFIPSIHCSSCIWLLENLNRLKDGIIHSSTNFLDKKVTVTFNRAKTSLREIVELLAHIGYEPKLNLENIENQVKSAVQKSLYYKIGIAGFAFGNIMLLSFPEYLSIDASSFALKQIFGALIILISLPVFFYCSSEYFISAFKGLRSKTINIDFPLTLGIIAFYGRSLYEILTHTGPGYMDSFAGLIFFLLIGRVFQNKTFDLLNFERNYKSYFPISVNVIHDGTERAVPLAKVNIGDRLIIRNNELIPVDSILVAGTAHVDYSFITGESNLTEKKAGEILYAGGKHVGSLIEITATKNVSQSYLTQLWNDAAVDRSLKKSLAGFSSAVSKYFTFVLLLVASSAFVYWVLYGGLTDAVKTFSAVLIIACPCALALSTPFALGNALRILGRVKLYLKNTHVVEKLYKVTTIVFDKTGTITQTGTEQIKFYGRTLTAEEEKIIASVARHSTHPFSRQIVATMTTKDYEEVDLFVETEGAGLEGFINGIYVKLGSMPFIRQSLNNYVEQIEIPEAVISGVFVSIDNRFRGYFEFSSGYRSGIEKMFSNLSGNYDIVLLSGDTDREKEQLEKITGNNIDMHFNQSPFDKMKYIQELQRNGATVLMIGDGLNDSGALIQSDVGISVSEDVLNFSPASDGIMNAANISRLPDFLKFTEDAVRAIKVSFAVSALYNIYGLYYAVTGKITPLFAAILMPISSVTVIVLTVALTSIFAKRRNLL